MTFENIMNKLIRKRMLLRMRFYAQICAGEVSR